MAAENPEESKANEMLKRFAAYMGKSTDDLEDMWNRRVKDEKYYIEKSKKNFEDTSNQIKNFKTKMGTIGVSADELESELESLRGEIAKVTDKEKKAALMKEKSALEMRNAGNVAVKTVGETAAKVIGIGLMGAITSMTGAVKRAAGGADAMDVAAGYMTDQIDIQNQKNQAIAGGMQTVGTALAGAGGTVGAFGLALTVAGGAVSFLSNQMSELAKSGIQFLLSQTRKMIEGFQVMSRIGAVFSGGMEDMTQTALKSGMTIEQFSKTIEASRNDLNRLGIGLNEAARKMGDVMNSREGKKLRDGLFGLGMSAEEQGQALAATMAIMAGPSGKLKASNAEVAEATGRYAKDLKIIANITGEDAKARMEKLRQDNDTLAFNSYLNGLSETERTKQVAAMALMSTEDQRAFREKKIYGTVISQDLNVARATNAGIRKAQDEAAEAATRGQLDTAEQAKIYNRNMKEAQEESIKRGKDMGLAQSGAAVEASKVLNANMNHYNKFGDIQQGINEITESQAKGAKQSGSDLMKVNQKFAKDLQDIARKHLPAFSDSLQATIKGIKEAVEASIANTAPATMGSMLERGWQLIKDNVGTILTLGAIAVGKDGLSKLVNMGSGGAGAASSARYAPGSMAPPTMSGGVGASSPIGGGTTAGASGIGNRIGQFAKSGMGRGIGGAAIGVGADMASNALVASGHEKLGAGVGVLGSMASGAMMGSMFGPLGTLAGGALGGAYGLYQNWGNIFGSKTPTPATDASASMSSGGGDTPAEASNKITDMGTNMKLMAEAWTKEKVDAMNDSLKRSADYLEQNVASNKEIKDLMGKLYKVMA
jgi:stringent starvation protein B